jgi:Tfp pilus assembly protein PilZ
VPEFLQIPYVRRCVVQRGGRRAEGVVCSLSVVGAYVTYVRPLPHLIPAVGECVNIAFQLLDRTAPVEAEALVTLQKIDDPEAVDSLPPGCGLTFTALDGGDRSGIETLLHDYQHAAHPLITPTLPHSGVTRIPYVQPCLMVGEQSAWEGVLCNLSVSGAYVTVDPIPPQGERIRLLFKAPRALDLVEAQCEVVWANPEEPCRAENLPPGCGVRFDDMTTSAREQIAQLIREYESLPRDGRC